MLGVQHGTAGSIIGIIFSAILLMLGYPFLLAAACFLVCVCGASLPDLIDPPGSQFHRSFGHNLITFFFLIVLSLCGIALSIIFRFQTWVYLLIICTAFTVSVLSHLILDMTTYMGLPMFAGKSILEKIGIRPNIIFKMIPFLKPLEKMISAFFAITSVIYLSKQIGGKLALILLFLPVWATLLLMGIALCTLSRWWWILLGIILIFLFCICIVLLLLLGVGIDFLLEKFKKKAKKK